MYCQVFNCGCSVFGHQLVFIQCDNAIVAPADGEVVVIEETEEGEYF